ncbi:hypothetical protein HanRHA438_Chr04g0160691 [Helianthus annuus]|nr:hypothetical protein HanRHA438_Chr04g0160691 [Helianthus annuus]
MWDKVFTTFCDFHSHIQNFQHIRPKLLLLTISYMVLNGICNSFFYFICGILFISKHNIFFIFFSSMCAFLKKAHTFLRLGSGRGRCAAPAPCVFDNTESKY